VALALSPGEPLSHALPRLATEQLTDAIARLDVLPRRDDEAFHRSVHSSRKALKKTRAVLRLARPTLGKRRYRRENAVLRDAARLLSPARDAAVLRRTLASVADEVPAPVVDRVDAALAAQQRLAIRHVVVGVVVDRVLAELRAAREEIRSWPEAGDDFAAIAPGIDRIYRRGRSAQHHVAELDPEASEDRGAEAWHEWRKRAKYLWYQLRVLQPVSPVIDSLVDEADELGELLGDDHDLAVLRELVRGEPERFGSAPEVAPLVVALDARSDDLRRPALELGRRLYLDEPEAFVRRLEVHWRAWAVRSSAVTVPRSIADLAQIS
jgi:CHAD domain-containing protein